MQQRWELESTQGATFFWNNEEGGFEWEDSEYIGDKALYKLIEEASNKLGEKLTENRKHSFEVQPVFAVRK